MVQFNNAYVLTYLEVDDKDNKKILDDASNLAQGQFGNKYDVFRSWPEITHDVFLPCLNETKREGEASNFYWDDIWKRPSRIADVEYDGEVFQIVHKMQTVNEDDIEILKAALRKALKAEALPDPDCNGARCFRFHYLFPHILCRASPLLSADWHSMRRSASSLHSCMKGVCVMRPILPNISVKAYSLYSDFLNIL